MTKAQLSFEPEVSSANLGLERGKPRLTKQLRRLAMMEFYYLLFIYTFTLFTFLWYLLYLRVYYLGKLNDIKVKATINLNFYVFLFYLSFFVISLLLSCFVYLVDLGGAALGRILTETIPEDFGILCDDPDPGKASRNNELAGQKDVTANSPSQPKRPKEGSVGATWNWVRDSFSDLSLKVTKNAAIRVSENNLTLRNHAALQNTIIEFTGNDTVPASTLEFETVRYPFGSGAVLQDDGKYKLYNVADPYAAKVIHAERMASGNTTLNYSFLDKCGINIALSTNKLGEPLARELTPEQAVHTAKLLGIKPDQLCDSQRVITNPILTHPSLKALTSGNSYSPPP